MTELSQLRQLGLFDARVPRYTSYPTAPHFSNDVGQKQTQAWIKSIPGDARISLYIHVPFCRRLCWFCACRTQGTSTLSPVKNYVETIKKELALVAEHLAPGVQIEHLHWGGGTPTLLPSETIADLADSVFQHVPMASDAQFSVEIDPNEIDDARMDALAKAGMNRASIGVQDFNPTIQETIGREQSYDVTKQAADGLRARGITSLNMDMLYGLPYQTKAGISDSVQKVMSLSPDRVALYGYAHVPWMAKRQALIPTDVLPTPEERLALFETARNLFVWDGYTEIGIDHFARPEDGLSLAQKAGTMHRNFQGYTEDSSNILIGIGASAISRYPQGYAQNNPSTSAYQSAILNQKLATSKGHEFSGEDLLRGRLIEVLMCDFAITYSDVAKDCGTTVMAVKKLLDPLILQFPGILDVTHNRLTIQPSGRPLARIIARALDAYHVSQTGHSPAV